MAVTTVAVLGVGRRAKGQGVKKACKCPSSEVFFILTGFSAIINNRQSARYP